jgi:NAD(P)-dependent dehydrogenase (short-subunit alcohol dehydrogenase family)
VTSTSWEGRVAVITGASSGIGAAVARLLTARGATVCLAARWREPPVTEPGVGARRYRVDLGDEAGVAALASGVLADCARIDVLVHGAGVLRSALVRGTSLADLDEQYRLNVRAPFQLTQLLLPRIVASRGQIVFVNSSAALAPGRARFGGYTATKYALKAIADSLRDEVNADGVRVLSVYPGRTASPMQAALHALEGRTYHGDRLLQPDDVAAALVSALELPPTAEVTNLSIRPFVKRTAS